MKETLELQKELILYMHKAVLLSGRIGDQVFQKAANITRLQYLLLSALDEPGIEMPSQQDIANRLSTTKGALSRQVSIAQKAGLISVMTSPVSRRENQLALTRKGRTALKSARVANRQLTRKRPRDIPEDDLRATVRTLKRVCEVLSELEHLYK